MTPQPDPHSHRTVLLYSGGVDSYCAAVLENPDVLLHVNMGGAYGDVQADRLTTPEGMEDRLVVLNIPELALFEYEHLNHILPARNLFLAVLGAQYGATILMASIAASRGSDKDYRFAELVSSVMSYVWQKQGHWNPTDRPTVLKLPVAHLTKVELVAAALKAGVPGHRLRDDTFSCYTPSNGQECGTCGPCGRKWAALAVNNIDPGFDGREAYRPYWDEVQSGKPLPHRSPQHVIDVYKAWNSPY